MVSTHLKNISQIGSFPQEPSQSSTQGTHTHTHTHTHTKWDPPPKSAIWHLSTCSGVKSSALRPDAGNFAPNGGNPTSFHQSSPGKSTLFQGGGISLIWSPLFLGILADSSQTLSEAQQNRVLSPHRPHACLGLSPVQWLNISLCILKQHTVSLSKDSVFFPAPSNCPHMPALWIDSLQGIQIALNIQTTTQIK